MQDWESICKAKLESLEDAVNRIQPGDGIFYGYGLSIPMAAVNAITKRLPKLGHIDFYTGLSLYPFDYLYKPEYKPYFNHHSNFYFYTERFAPDKEKCDFFAYQFSKTEWLFDHYVNADVVLFECTPPDAEGNMNYSLYGICVNDYAVKKAKTIIALVNENLPWVYGEKNTIHVSQVTSIVESHHPIANVPIQPPGEIDIAIARHIVDRIEDGSTIQIGIGDLANAICSFLDTKKDLGIHTEMFVDAMVDLMRKGIINNSRKTFLPGETTCSFGGQNDESYKFIDKNSALRMYPIGFINDPNNIAKNDNMVSINNTLSMDLTGQACSETLGFKQYSGTGGQVDFTRGADMSKGGQAFLALPSTYNTKEGPQSRIILTLAPGQIVTLPRTEVDKVVTEYGIAEMKNKPVSQRVKAMIAIAHPQFRDELTAGAKKEGLI